MATEPPPSNPSTGVDKKSLTESAQRIGWAFLTQYYQFLNKDASRLHCFYTKRSTLIHSTEGEDATACYGQQEIHAKIMSLEFEECKVYISNVDSQSSSEGGIIVQVIGEMSNKGQPWRKFAQTFFLAEQPNGYFVLNDICRYMREGDVEPSSSSTAEVEAASTPIPTSTPLTNGHHHEEEHVPIIEKQSTPTPREVTPVPEEVVREPSPVPTPAAVESEPEPTPAPAPEPQKEEAKAEEKPVEASPVLTTESAPAEAVSDGVVTSEPAVAKPAPTPSPAPATSSSTPTSAPSPASVTPSPSAAPEKPAAASTPAPATAPSKPVTKSWASLAASGAQKWGSKAVLETRGVVSSPSTSGPEASTSTSEAASPSAHPGASSSSSSAPAKKEGKSEFAPAVLALTHAACFVKGVVETVNEHELRKLLETRFGQLRELDIIRSKACAFIEFEKLDGARRAIQASLRPSEGGEGGIYCPTTDSDGPRLLHVVTRKPQGERPKSTPSSTPAGGPAGRTAGGGGQGGGQGGGNRARFEGGGGENGGKGRSGSGPGGERSGGAQSGQGKSSAAGGARSRGQQQQQGQGQGQQGKGNAAK